MSQKPTFKSTRHHTHSGFTLVEMLVSVALVLLMMTIFAQVFGIASGAVHTQRGIAENDQRARSFSNVIRNDLSFRTMQNVLPYFPSERSADSPTSFANRQGYFYVSANNPADGLDDVLQFTVSAPIGYFGHAELLTLPNVIDPDGDNDISDSTFAFSVNPNQPEADDEQVVADATSRSSAAEVVYFVRNGNLYRRVLLMREAMPIAGEELDSQPSDRVGADFFTAYPGVTAGRFQIFRGAGADGIWGNTDDDAPDVNDFWLYFDFSARPQLGGPGVGGGTLFNGIDALNNSDAATFARISNPRFRFGFDPIAGQPREYSSLGAGGQFIGRFLHEETSSPFFNYPQGPCAIEDATGTPTAAIGNGDPMDFINGSNGVTNLTMTAGGIVAEFPAGSRRSEDLLMTNVHEFRIEIWDDRLERFVVPAHLEVAAGLDGTVGTADDVPGDYHAIRRMNGGGYGPLGTGGANALVPLANRVFDTWTLYPPTMPGGLGALGFGPDRNDDGTSEVVVGPPRVVPQPPFRALTLYDSSEPLHVPAGGPFTSNVRWTPGTTYAVGDRVFPEHAYDVMATPYGEARHAGYSYYYECVVAGDSGLFDNAVDPDYQPNWPTTPGAVVTESNVPIATTPAQWVAVDNRRPLKAIRITIRVLDPRTDQMRQVTLTESLID